ncbi:uncharacterized protein LOC102809372 [Saccoglossus kowalevskii]|uniref:Uncharacterized protein LOC102809372 n=1 Tax=Saccoglossus kowalevskii TaxID=10224 RepID=A0ABM0M493_SACKO|nr:PREDICTED: uncharacterized protein LOC102809372 [Saccoglossus kowalevskii]
MVLRLPDGKLREITETLEKWSMITSCTKRELLSLIGILSFACKCIPAGRTFLRRMINLSTTVTKLQQHLTLTQPFYLDLQWWRDFLPMWNGSAHFLQSKWTPSPEMELYTDASSTLGCGGYFNGEWFSLPWSSIPSSTKPDLSIAWKELLPIFLACSIWGSLWHGKKVLFHCDNESIVNIWRKGSSRCPFIMALVRAIFFKAAKSNFHVMVTHISGINNNIADSLSRLQLQRFRSLAPQATKYPINTRDYIKQLQHLLPKVTSKKKSQILRLSLSGRLDTANICCRSVSVFQVLSRS